MQFSKEINETIGNTYGFLVYTGGLPGIPTVTVENPDIADVKVIGKYGEGSYYCEITPKKAGTTNLKAQLQGEEISQKIVFKNNLKFSREINEAAGNTYGFLVYTGGLSGTPTVTVEDSEIADVKVIGKYEEGSYYCEITSKKVGSTTLIAELNGEEIKQAIFFM